MRRAPPDATALVPIGGAAVRRKSLITLLF
jgi:hypothetical protein